MEKNGYNWNIDKIRKQDEIERNWTKLNKNEKNKKKIDNWNRNNWTKNEITNKKKWNKMGQFKKIVKSNETIFSEKKIAKETNLFGF